MLVFLFLFFSFSLFLPLFFPFLFFFFSFTLICFFLGVPVAASLCAPQSRLQDHMDVLEEPPLMSTRHFPFGFFFLSGRVPREGGRGARWDRVWATLRAAGWDEDREQCLGS